MKTYIHIQYPKLLILACSFAFSYLLYDQGAFDALPSLLHGHGYISMFIAGMLFSFGFTTPFAIAMFLAMADLVNPFYGAIVGGVGAVASDTFIFEFVRFSFADELHRLKQCRLCRWVRDRIHHENIPERIRQYILWSMAGLVIASPLPDELGVTLLSGFTELKERPFMMICYAFNTLGIFAVLMIGQLIS